MVIPWLTEKSRFGWSPTLTWIHDWGLKQVISLRRIFLNWWIIPSLARRHLRGELILERSLRYLQGVTSYIAPWMASRFQSPGKFCLWNLESCFLESTIQLKESGILLIIGVHNPSSTDKYWNQVPGIRNPQRGIPNPRMSWIPFHGAL